MGATVSGWAPDMPLLLGCLAASIAGGVGMYLGIAAVFELAYYRRRDEAASWKCQPRKWLSPQQLRQQLLLGTGNIFGASVLSGLFVYHVKTGGHTTLYYSVADRGLLYTVASGVGYFLFTDLLLYWAHRTYHRPALFRSIHRYHHRYTSPTAVTAMAMHPVEFFTYQSIMAIPLFVLPVHVGPVIMTLLYSHYFALVDHSGVKTHSWFPWQPPTQFHDDHHSQFHVNYGQNSAMWDKLFGSHRRVGRRYGAGVFGGHGAAAPGDEGPAPYVDYGRRAAAAAEVAARGGAPDGDVPAGVPADVAADLAGDAGSDGASA